jgi:putative hydrolase of the HAD superfamily
VSPTVAPHAVLLDAGGVFLLPDPARIVAAFARAEVSVSPATLADAHYRAAAAFRPELDLDARWAESWQEYLAAYARACCDDGADLAFVHEHLDSEFADAALWSEVIPDSVTGLRALAATGVRLGVVSNADGLMARRLREREILQVGPGPGVEVGCVVDSGEVGVMKPDPRIFELALHALGVDAGETWFVGDMPAFDVRGAANAGIHAVLLDPLGIHAAAPYDTVASLGDLARRIEALPRTRTDFSLAGARAAAARDQTARWVGELLASPGSDNAVLAAALAQEEHWWLGPVALPVSELERLAGPEDDALCPIDDEDWEDDVAAMERSVEAGWEPPPLLAEFQDGRVLLQDGNHRYEALVREGAERAWVLVYFPDAASRDEYAASLPAAALDPGAGGPADAATAS